MKYRFEKNVRIFEEILGYCYKRGCRQVDSGMLFDEKATYFNISAKVPGLSDETITALKEQLNKKRQHEIEECYWQTNDENGMGDELDLVAIMVDEVRLSYENEVLTFAIKRAEG